MTDGLIYAPDGTAFDPRYNASMDNRAGWDKVEYAGRDGLATINGQDVGYFAHRPAWHGKGRSGAALTGEEIALETGVARRGPNGEVVWLTFDAEPVTRKGAERMRWINNAFTGEAYPHLVTQRHGVIQPRRTVEFAEALLREAVEHRVLFETMVGLSSEARGNFHTLAVSLRIPEGLTLKALDGREDLLIVFLNILNSFDGRGKFRANVSPWRIECRNSARFAARDAVSSWDIRHTGDVEGRVAEAQQQLGLTFAYIDAFQQEAETLLNTPVAHLPQRLQTVDDLILSLFPPKPNEKERGRKERYDRVNEMVAIAKDPKGPVGSLATDPSLWTVEMAVGHWLDWKAPVMGADDDTTRGQRMLEGAADTQKDRVHATLRALATV